MCSPSHSAVIARGVASFKRKKELIGHFGSEKNMIGKTEEKKVIDWSSAFSALQSMPYLAT